MTFIACERMFSEPLKYNTPVSSFGGRGVCLRGTVRHYLTASGPFFAPAPAPKERYCYDENQGSVEPGYIKIMG